MRTPLYWVHWLREAFRSRPRRGPQFFRPQVMPLEDRRVLSTTLFGKPTIFAYAGVGVQENVVASLNGVFNGSQDLTASDYTVQIDWGDGSGLQPADLARDTQIPSQPFLVKGSHTYTQINSSYTIQVQATGPDNITVTQNTCTADVSQMPSGIPGIAPIPITPPLPPSNVSVQLFGEPTIFAYAGVGFKENVLASFNGTLNGNQDLTISDYTAQVNWGDSNQWQTVSVAPNSGVPSQPFLVKGSHVYVTANQTYQVVVFLQGPDGTSTTDQSVSVDVSAMPNSVVGIPPNPITPPLPPSDVGVQLFGEPTVFAYAGVGFQQNVLASFNGTLNGNQDLTITDYTAQVNWGDSSQWQTVSLAPNSGVPSQPFLVKGSHVYATANQTYQVVVFLQGPDGTSTSDQSVSVDVSAMPGGIVGSRPIRSPRRNPPATSACNCSASRRSLRTPAWASSKTFWLPSTVRLTGTRT